MRYGSLILEKKEYVYLKRILNISGYVGDHETQKCFAKLTDELKIAQIVDNDEMPDKIIRFNSKVTVVFENGLEKTVQVVIPSNKDVSQNKISILTPLGSALIGYSENDVIEWIFPKGKQVIKIKEVIQVNSCSDIDTVI